MTDYNLFTFYIVAAMSAAIFATYQIYLPAIAILKKKALDDPRITERLGFFINSKFLAVIVFMIIAVIIFPMLIVPILYEPWRKSFTDSFVTGVLM